MARYGNLKPPFKEEDSPNPIDPYGISKLAAEKILINIVKSTILNTILLYHTI